MSDSILVPRTALIDAQWWLLSAAQVFSTSGLPQYAESFVDRSKVMRDILDEADAGITVIDGKRFRDIAYVAARLNVTTGTLANWRVSGRGPVYKKEGKKVLYPEADLENFRIDNPTVRSTSELEVAHV